MTTIIELQRHTRNKIVGLDRLGNLDIDTRPFFKVSAPTERVSLRSARDSFMASDYGDLGHYSNKTPSRSQLSKVKFSMRKFGSHFEGGSSECPKNIWLNASTGKNVALDSLDTTDIGLRL